MPAARADSSKPATQRAKPCCCASSSIDTPADCAAAGVIAGGCGAVDGGLAQAVRPTASSVAAWCRIRAIGKECIRGFSSSGRIVV